MKVTDINTTTLAYMGDAVYEVYIREYIIGLGCMSADKLHKVAVGYVKAGAQAKAIKSIFEELTEKEQKLVKRARNRKSVTKAKNADPITYKWATAFEALIGYLYFVNEKVRMEEIIKRAIEVIQSEE